MDSTVPRVHPIVGTFLTGMWADCRVPNVSGQDRDSQGPFSTNLRVEMDRTGVTNSELARGLGVTERQITRWRGGTMPRSYATVAAIARYFGRSTEWFYTDHEKAAA